jgi:hypothetical protein
VTGRNRRTRRAFIEESRGLSKLDSLQSGMDEMATALPLPIAWHGAR